MTAPTPEIREENATETADLTSQITGESFSSDEPQHWFSTLNRSQKRFHILFYALAALTGILIVQFVWQIAVLTAGQ